MSDDTVQSCQSCGASVYPEHISKGIAGFLGGNVLCPHCFADARKSLGSAHGVAFSDAKDETGDEETIRAIAFDAGRAESSPASTGIHGFSGDSLASGAASILDDAKYHRQLNPVGQDATRCRTFHSKLNDSAVAFMNDQLNTWVDSHPQINIKFATSAIGIFEGKQKDPNLIVTVFY